jgi:hypothetical protein
MTGFLPNGKRRAAALIAAYAIALQAVFVTLAPMQVQADGRLAVYCSGNAGVVAPDTDDPTAPAPGKMQCVFCGACAAGSAVLPAQAGLAYSPVPLPLSLSSTAPGERVIAFRLRDGPARAPPLTV